MLQSSSRCLWGVGPYFYRLPERAKYSKVLVSAHAGARAFVRARATVGPTLQFLVRGDATVAQLLSRLKCASSGVVRMLSASFMTSSMAPPAFVRSVSAQRAQKEPSNDEAEKPPLVFLPYVAGVSESIS